jgi:class 3 adenylate cyclase
MSLEEIARLTGESPEDLSAWHAMGLLDDEGPVMVQAERARLIGFAAKRGVPPAEVARLSAQHGDMLATFVQWGAGPERSTTHNLDEAAQVSGIELALLQRILTAAGLAEQPVVYQDDIEVLGMMKMALDFGIPTDVMLQMVRVFADASYKVADAVTRLFHLHVHEQFRVQGLAGAELMAATQSIAGPMTELFEPAVLYFHRKAWERANREDMLVHLIEESTTPSSVPGEVVRTVVFVDLSGFTPLTEAMGDRAAAEVLDRFSDLVREAAATCAGQVVKQIGDAFMLVFADARSAVNCGIAMQREAAVQPRFPALRIGAHTGSLLFREGDYLGGSVNIAARVAAAAGRHQLLVTPPVMLGAGEVADVTFTSLGSRQLKGLTDEVELFEVEPTTPRLDRLIDRVCGMELTPDTVEGTVAWQGEQLSFCSASCLQRFLGAPERYRPAGTVA